MIKGWNHDILAMSHSKPTPNLLLKLFLRPGSSLAGPVRRIYQSPQCDAVICWNFIFQASPCLTQTVLKCW